MTMNALSKMRNAARNVLTCSAVLLGAAVCTIPGAVVAGPGHSHDHAGGEHGHSHDHAGHDHAGSTNADGHTHPEVLAYRLTGTKELHYDSTAQAEQQLKIFRRLGCEAQLESHAGHADVVLRSPQWRRITVKGHAAASKWEKWLATAGFDTWHGHIDERLLHGPEAVDFRQKEWKTLHFDGARAADRPQITRALKQLGCQVREERHGDHADVTFRCPVWSTIRVADHTSAERWLSWMKGAGFETRHTHPAADRRSDSPISSLR